MTHQATSADVPPGSPPLTAGVTSPDDPHSDKRDVNWLASLTLPATCKLPPVDESAAERAREWDGIQLASAEAASRFVCCTDCHNATRAGLVSAGGQGIVMQACAACHH